MPLVSVVTATYDRAHLLPRLYRSLCAQTFEDFEWVVIDDGSRDRTEALVADLAAAAPFPVVLRRQPNSGKHAALNHAARIASGRYFAAIDSDDHYEPHALARLVDSWGELEHREDVCEVQGYTADEHGRLIGNPFPPGLDESDYLSLVYRHRAVGDRMGMHRTDLIRAFPFPEDLGRFVNEAIVWHRLARAGYRVRLLHEVLARKEYLPTGLTGSERRDLRERAPSNLVFHRELATYPQLPLKERYRTYANIVRNGIHTGSLRPGPRLGWWLAAAPIGLVLAVRDRRAAQTFARSR